MNNEINYWLEGLDDLSYEKVLDYITNLQQENERLNNMLDNADNKNLSLIEEINDKQDIIDKANEYLHKVETLAMLDGKIIFSINIFRNILQNENQEKAIIKR